MTNDLLRQQMRYFALPEQATENDLETYCCVVPMGTAYTNTRYRILSNPHNWSNDDLAAAVDPAGAPFGYRMEGGGTIVCIYTD